jgi:hypothetical protein
MRLPLKKKPGDPVLATDWNLLLDAIEARTPRPGYGLQFISSSGGFSYSSPPPAVERDRGQPPFSVIAIEVDGSRYKVTIKEGWVIDRRPKTADHPHVKFFMPECGGTRLDTRPRPQISMSIYDILWCRYKTDKAGLVTGTPEIIVDSGDKDGVHYWPKDPEGYGGEGDYYVKLFKLELDDDGFPMVIVYQQSDIEHYAQLWTGENVGGGAGIYKKHDEAENLYKFRSVDGRGSYTGDSPNTGTTAQIKVVTDGDVVRVLGNGKKGSLWYSGFGYPYNPVKILEWNDGLVTTSGNWLLSQGWEGYALVEYTI